MGATLKLIVAAPLQQQTAPLPESSAAGLSVVGTYSDGEN
jgi:hypothetical protein